MRPDNRILAAAMSALAVASILTLSSIILSPPAAPNPGTPGTTDPPPSEPPTCPRSAGLCVERVVTRVIDGDTLNVEGGLRIRLVLVDAPELHEQGGPEARAYLKDVCLGALAHVDEDDHQIGDDPYGRVLAVVRCRGVHANAALIASGLADPYYAFCARSEFGGEAWTGCASPPPPADCDPAYPGVCIPSPPPDLDCRDIPHRNFRVLPPDPHRFDGDGDGVGCEG